MQIKDNWLLLCCFMLTVNELVKKILNLYYNCNSIVRIIELVILFIGSIFLVFHIIEYRKCNTTDRNVKFHELLLASLLPIYKIVYLYAQNITKVAHSISVLIITIGVMSFLVNYCIFKYILKKSAISFNLTLLTNFFLWNYFILANNITELNSYIVIYFIIFVLLLQFNFNKIITFCKNTSIVLLILLSVNIVFNNINLIKFHFSELKNSSLPKDIKSCDKDIYIFILDEYASKNKLKKMGYDNSDFINYLKAKGFKTFDNIYSNYTKTQVSIPSVLNLDYKEKLLPTTSDAVNNAKLFSYAKKAGYKITYINSYPTDFHIKQGLIDEVIINGNKAYLQTLHLFIPHGYLCNYLTKQLDLESDIFYFIKTYINRSGKKFLLVHLLMPHYPYLYDENGNKNKNTELINMGDYSVPDETSYINYLKYTNKKILELVDILLVSKKKPIIVITGDHGLRPYYGKISKKLENSDYKNGSDTIPDAFSTFTAYYTSDVEIQNSKNVRSLINFFRIFTNDTFNTQYKMLDDRFFYVYMKSNATLLNELEGFKYILKK